MSGLALVAAELGAVVTGSDRSAGLRIERLRGRGIPVSVGHDAANVPDGAELVYSSAVEVSNVERERARTLGLRELRRGELLAEVAALRPSIAVAGAHGKTTTAAMIVQALRAAGHEPGYLIGADLLATGTNAEWGSGEWLVLETDESDRTFLALEPDVAVVTNVELDHHREYSSQSELEEAFQAFVAGARTVVSWDAPGVELGPGTSRFEWRGLEVRLPVPGAHNALNAAAALEVCRAIGADIGRSVAGLATFAGTARRFQQLGRSPEGALVYDDYAHHPTEVQATLDAARTLAPDRLVAVMQPFGYLRVRHLAAAFAQALERADLALVLDIHALREVLPGVSSDQISGAMPAGAAVRLPGTDDAYDYLREHLRPGDLCVTLGGDEMGELAQRLVA
jgi:UDP-N-acetylmuramate--alanine ligase